MFAAKIFRTLLCIIVLLLAVIAKRQLLQIRQYAWIQHLKAQRHSIISMRRNDKTVSRNFSLIERKKSRLLSNFRRLYVKLIYFLLFYSNQSDFVSRSKSMIFILSTSPKRFETISPTRKFALWIERRDTIKTAERAVQLARRRISLSLYKM